MFLYLFFALLRSAAAVDEDVFLSMDCVLRKIRHNSNNIEADSLARNYICLTLYSASKLALP